MRGLWRSTIDMARENAYSAITVQATTQATREALSKELGFQEVAAVRFDEWEQGEAGAAGLVEKLRKGGLVGWKRKSESPSP